MSAGGQGARCFVEGTIVQKPDGKMWVEVTCLQKNDPVRGSGSQAVVYVKSIEHLLLGRQELAEVQANGARLITTSSHRYEVRKGWPKGANARNILSYG